jgi:hypothetical protein
MHKELLEMHDVPESLGTEVIGALWSLKSSIMQC